MKVPISIVFVSLVHNLSVKKYLKLSLNYQKSNTENVNTLNNFIWNKSYITWTRASVKSVCLAKCSLNPTGG